MINTRYAHRGFHDKPQIPENSLPAFRRAIERGWGAELDVHLLKDGTLAVFHDSELSRCTGTVGILEDLTYEEMKMLRLEGTDNQIPTFDEVLAMFEGKTALIIELKTYRGNAKALVKAVCERMDHYNGDFCIESFDPRALVFLRFMRPEICRGQLSQDFFKNAEAPVANWQKRPLTNLWFNILTAPDFIAYKFEDRDNKANRRCVRKPKVQEVCWTIRNKTDLMIVEHDGAIPIFETFDPNK